MVSENLVIAHYIWGQFFAINNDIVDSPSFVIKEDIFQDGRKNIKLDLHLSNKVVTSFQES